MSKMPEGYPCRFDFSGTRLVITEKHGEDPYGWPSGRAFTDAQVEEITRLVNRANRHIHEGANCPKCGSGSTERVETHCFQCGHDFDEINREVTDEMACRACQTYHHKGGICDVAVWEGCRNLTNFKTALTAALKEG